MPKKFLGENSKAVVARARKAAQRDEEQQKKQAALEDEYWRDDDKHGDRKQQRKDDREKKRSEALERKKESQVLLDEETASIKSAKPPPPAKVTRADIETQKEREAKASAKPKAPILEEMPLEENFNRMLGAEGEARSVDDAISVLSVKDPELDKHPERRVKAAYKEFEDIHLPRLKAEFPNLRLSQWKQMLKKDWMKSPDNPLNQRSRAYNEK